VKISAPFQDEGQREALRKFYARESQPFQITNAHLWKFAKWSSILAGLLGLLIWRGWL